MVEYEDWNFVEVPTSVLNMGRLKALDPQEVMLANWNYCDNRSIYSLTERPTLEEVINSVESGSCKKRPFRKCEYNEGSLL